MYHLKGGILQFLNLCPLASCGFCVNTIYYQGKKTFLRRFARCLDLWVQRQECKSQYHCVNSVKTTIWLCPKAYDQSSHGFLMVGGMACILGIRTGIQTGSSWSLPRHPCLYHTVGCLLPGSTQGSQSFLAPYQA